MAQHKPKTIVPDTQVAASRTKIFHMLWRNFQWVVPQLSNTILTLTSAVADFLPEVGWRRTTWLPFSPGSCFFPHSILSTKWRKWSHKCAFIGQPLGDVFLNQDPFQSFKTSFTIIHPKLCAIWETYMKLLQDLVAVNTCKPSQWQQPNVKWINGHDNRLSFAGMSMGWPCSKPLSQNGP